MLEDGVLNQQGWELRAEAVGVKQAPARVSLSPAAAAPTGALSRSRIQVTPRSGPGPAPPTFLPLPGAGGSRSESLQVYSTDPLQLTFPLSLSAQLPRPMGSPEGPGKMNVNHRRRPSVPPDRTCTKDRRGDSQLPSGACAPGHIHAGQVKLHVPFDPDLVFLDTRPGESHGPQGSPAGQASQLDAEKVAKHCWKPIPVATSGQRGALGMRSGQRTYKKPEAWSRVEHLTAGRMGNHHVYSPTDGVQRITERN